MSGINVEQIGRRHYLRNLPFGARHVAKDAGCKWDPEQRAWWTGKASVAEQVAACGSSGDGSGSQADRQAPGPDATVAGRVRYKGRTYYLAGRAEYRYRDSVDPITTRDGSKYLIYFRDGAKSFWAARSEVEVLKRYDRPQTIAALRRFAAAAKSHGTDECGCYCHRAHNAGAPGSILYDGCDRCGCEA